ncbi:MAG: hypothetical protein MRY83_03280 [Flavobacteriales bacterium]|nr:hypothetical protein [Flavobacteriales bacterium]
MINSTRLLLVSLWVLSSILISARSEGQGFEVSPVILHFDAEAGASQTKTLLVSNYFSKRRAFTVSMTDFTRDSLGGKKFFEAGKYSRSCADWISVSPSFFEVDPNEVKEITVTMKVPSGETSSKWTMLRISATKERTAFDADKGTSGGILVTPTIGVHVYQSPRSNVNFKARISNLKEVTKASDNQRKLSVFVENVGEKNIEAKLFLLIADLENATETKTPIRKVPMFPGATRRVELDLPTDLAPGNYSVAAILDYGHNTPLEGIQTEIEIK